jgi:hypothetical protein
MCSQVSGKNGFHVITSLYEKPHISHCLSSMELLQLREWKRADPPTYGAGPASISLSRSVM